MVPPLIAVAPRKTVKTADLCGGTAETLNMFKTSAVPPRVGPISEASPRHRHYRRGTAITAAAPGHRHDCRGTVQSRKSRLVLLRRSQVVIIWRLSVITIMSPVTSFFDILQLQCLQRVMGADVFLPGECHWLKISHQCMKTGFSFHLHNSKYH